MITEKQQQVLNIIKDNMRPPSIGQIARILKRQRQTVYDHLKASQKKGYINKKFYPLTESEGLNIDISGTHYDCRTICKQ